MNRKKQNKAKSAAARTAIFCVLALLGVNIIFGESARYISSNRDKARHFFFKGALKEAEEEYDAAHEYYKKAYQADSSYVDAAFYYGSGRFTLNSDTLLSRNEKIRSMTIARPMIDRYPRDLYNSLMYAYMALMADSIPEAIRVYESLEKHHPTESQIQIYKAGAYANLQMVDSAVAAIRRYENIEGTSFESTVQKVRYHMINSDTVAVINELTNLVEANPGNAEFVVCKGKVFELLEMPDSALYYMELAAKMDPDDGVAKSELAQCYAQRGDSIEYDRLTYEALMSENLQKEVKLRILADYIQRIISEKADTKRSDKLFSTLSEQYPHDPTLLELGSRYAAARKDYKSAIEQISYAMDLDKENTENYVGTLMSYYIMDEQPQKALDLYDRFMADNDEEEMHYDENLAMLYASAAQEAGKNDKAFEIFDRMLQRISPALHISDTTINKAALRNLDFYSLYLASNYYEMAGDIYYKAENLPEAFRSYENALAILPDNALALNNYAYFSVEKGKAAPGSPEFEKAKEMSRRSLELTETNPNPTYLDTYAWILFKEKDFDGAEEVQRLAIETAEKDDDLNAEYFSHFGDILFMNQKPEEALKQWEKALEMEPDDQLLQKKVKHKTFFYE